jgi:hypothetical protein
MGVSQVTRALLGQLGAASYLPCRSEHKSNHREYPRGCVGTHSLSVVQFCSDSGWRFGTLVLGPDVVGLLECRWARYFPSTKGRKHEGDDYGEGY